MAVNTFKYAPMLVFGFPASIFLSVGKLIFAPIDNSSMVIFRRSLAVRIFSPNWVKSACILEFNFIEFLGISENSLSVKSS